MQEAGRLGSLLVYFKPPGKLSKVNILLVGGVGAGKSSLISVSCCEAVNALIGNPKTLFLLVATARPV